MRLDPTSLHLDTPSSLDEVLDLLAHQGSAVTPIAGGTDIMVTLAAGQDPRRKFVNIWGLAELAGIEALPDRVKIGALTTYAQIRRDPILRAEFPMLCQAAEQSGAIAIQNRGTLGGNIINASPAADSPPALVAYEARLRLAARRGGQRHEREVEYRRFHVGYKQFDRRPDELLVSIELPRRRPSDAVHYYRKVGTRRAQAIAKVGLAAFGVKDSTGRATVRMGLSSVGPTVLVPWASEQTVARGVLDAQTIERALVELRGELSPIDDVRSSAGYRACVAANLVADFLTQLLNR